MPSFPQQKLILPDGTQISRGLTVSRLDKEISDRGETPAGTKEDKVKKLTSLIAQELGNFGQHGSLPDGRRIHTLTVPMLRSEILSLKGNTDGSRNILLKELEHLNRTLNLNLPDKDIAQATTAQQVPPSGGGSGTTLVMPPPVAGRPILPIFSFNDGALSPAGAPYMLATSDPMVAVLPDSALSIITATLDEVWTERGSLPLSMLFFLLCSGVKVDTSAHTLSLGTLPTLDALIKLHDRFAPDLMAAGQQKSIKDVRHLCFDLARSQNIVWKVSDFIQPESPTTPLSSGLATIVSLGSWPQDLKKFSMLTLLTGGMARAHDRESSNNVRLLALDRDCFSSHGGLIPDSISHMAVGDDLRGSVFDIIKDSIFEFKNVPWAPLPLNVSSYFELRQLDIGVEKETPAILDSILPDVLANETELNLTRRLMSGAPAHCYRSVINTLKALLFPSLEARRPNSLATLHQLEIALEPYAQVIPNVIDLDLEPGNSDIGSPHTAYARVEAVRALHLTRMDLGSTQSRGSSAYCDNLSGGHSAARLLSNAAIAAEPVLTAIKRQPASQAGHLEITKLTLRSGSALLIRAVGTPPEKSLLAVIPELSLIYSVVPGSISEYVGSELLKGEDMTDSTALAQLSAALPSEMLTQMCIGMFPDLKILATIYTAFRASMVMGGTTSFQAPTIEILTTDLAQFEEFVVFLIRLFAALGMPTADLHNLTICAKDLRLVLPHQASSALTQTLGPALSRTLASFGKVVKAWTALPTSAPLCPLVPITSELTQAAQALRAARRQDLSFLGIGDSLSEATRLHFRPATALATASTRTVKRQAISPPSHVVSKRQVLTYGAKWREVSVQKCAIGRVASWGGFFNVDLMEASWKADFKESSFKNNYLSCLLCIRRGDKEFEARVPPNVSQEELKMLKIWWDSKKGSSFSIDKPPDFR